MASQTVTADFTSTIVFPNSGEILVIGEGVLGEVAGIAINAGGNGDDREITIEGKVRGVDDTQPACIGLLMGNEAEPDGAENFRVTVTGTGEASGLDFGIIAFAEGALIDNRGLIKGAEALSGQLAQSHILNAGRILGTAAGIGLSGSENVIENSGRIAAAVGPAVLLSGDDNGLVNTGTIAGGTDGAAIFLDTSLFAQSRFTNFGKVTSSGIAFESSAGEEFVVNRGRIEGDVVLGDGGDTFVNAANAVVTGRLIGGLRGDFYILYGHKVRIVEADELGNDGVAADFNYRLGANIEELMLIGRKNINGTGNIIDNEIQGNEGNNVLAGKAGEDQLNGRGGNDRLVGGADSDTFIFEDQSGKDVIADFEFGADTIDLREVRMVPDDATLAAVTRQRGRDVVIDLGNGNSIRILDVERQDVLDATITLNSQIN